MNPFSMSGAWGPGITRIYDQVVATGMAPIYRQMIDELLAGQALDVATVLDVGCGSGFATAILAGKFPGARVIGIDLSASAIAMAQARYRHLPNLQFQVGNAQALAFPEQHFDLVISTGSIKHWPDPAQGVCEMLRVLKPAGLSVMVETDPSGTRQKDRHFVSYWRYGAACLPRASSWYFKRYVAGQSPGLRALTGWFEQGAAQDVKAMAHPEFPFNVVMARV